MYCTISSYGKFYFSNFFVFAFKRFRILLEFIIITLLFVYFTPTFKKILKKEFFDKVCHQRIAGSKISEKRKL